jgi:hypothetical protein
MVIIVILLGMQIYLQLRTLSILENSIVVDTPKVDYSKLNDQRQQHLVKVILKRHKVEQPLAEQIVALAHKYERNDFPRAIDILAVVGIESEFRPHVKSQLATDPAVGLMQVRLGIWKINPKEMADIENHIKYGSRILADYYDQLKGNKKAAIIAYNAGITAYRNREYTYRYVRKFEIEHASYFSCVRNDTKQWST